MRDQELGKRLREWMALAGLPAPARVSKVVTRRLGHAYPLYRRGYEECFEKIAQWLWGIEGVLTFGRQGLFADDNTHHALAMAYGAARCLSPRADSTMRGVGRSTGKSSKTTSSRIRLGWWIPAGSRLEGEYANSFGRATFRRSSICQQDGVVPGLCSASRQHETP